MHQFREFFGVCEVLFFLLDHKDEIVDFLINELFQLLPVNGSALVPEDYPIQSLVLEELGPQHMVLSIVFFFEGQQFSEVLYKVDFPVCEGGRERSLAFIFDYLAFLLIQERLGADPGIFLEVSDVDVGVVVFVFGGSIRLSDP